MSYPTGGNFNSQFEHLDHNQTQTSTGKRNANSTKNTDEDLLNSKSKRLFGVPYSKLSSEQVQLLLSSLSSATRTPHQTIGYGSGSGDGGNLNGGISQQPIYPPSFDPNHQTNTTSSLIDPRLLNQVNHISGIPSSSTFSNQHTTTSTSTQLAKRSRSNLDSDSDSEDSDDETTNGRRKPRTKRLRVEKKDPRYQTMFNLTRLHWIRYFSVASLDEQDNDSGVNEVIEDILIQSYGNDVNSKRNRSFKTAAIEKVRKWARDWQRAVIRDMKVHLDTLKGIHPQLEALSSNQDEWIAFVCSNCNIPVFRSVMKPVSLYIDWTVVFKDEKLKNFFVSVYGYFCWIVYCYQNRLDDEDDDELSLFEKFRLVGKAPAFQNIDKSDLPFRSESSSRSSKPKLTEEKKTNQQQFLGQIKIVSQPSNMLMITNGGDKRHGALNGPASGGHSDDRERPGERQPDTTSSSSKSYSKSSEHTGATGIDDGAINSQDYTGGDGGGSGGYSDGYEDEESRDRVPSRSSTSNTET